MTQHALTNPLTNPHGSTGPKGIPIETLLEYRAKGLTIIEVSKLVGTSIENVQRRLANLSLDTLDQFNNHKAAIYDIVERKHLNKLVHEESKRPMEDMTVAAIAGDKGRVIRGLATEVVDHRVLQIDALAAVKELRRQVEEGGEG